MGVCSGITLEQAIALARDSHPRLQAGSAQIEAARAGIITAKARPNPEVQTMAGYQYFRVPNNITGPMQAYAASQPLELGRLRPTRIEFAERTRQSTEIALTEIRLELLSAVRRAWFEALHFREQIAILNENLRLVEELRQKIQVRVEVGEAGRLELIRAETEVATARNAVATARLQYVSQLSQLRATIGLPPDSDIDQQGALENPPPLPPLAELRQQLLDRHPSLALARNEIRRADARLDYENALKRPQPSLRAEYERMPDVPNYRIGISIPLPVFNRREGPIAEAVALVKEAQAIANSRQLQLLAGLESAYGRYQTTTQLLETYQRGVLVEAEAAVRAAQAAYQLGERGIVDVLDAQRALRTVRLDFLNAQYDRQQALVDIDELRGIIPGVN
ncbi:outer membrane protein CzcC [Bryobacterales bacterium F-183]|nr:outer membrane protein CzcC [Bryobacterales bacterium F-183]